MSAASEIARLRQKIDRAKEATGTVVRDNSREVIRDEGRIDTARMINGQAYAVDGNEIHVGNNTEYFPYQEEGTRGPIRPRNAEALRFEIGGRVIYAKEVRGVEAMNSLTRGLNRSKGQIKIIWGG